MIRKELVFISNKDSFRKTNFKNYKKYITKSKIINIFLAIGILTTLFFIGKPYLSKEITNRVNDKVISAYANGNDNIKLSWFEQALMEKSETGETPEQKVQITDSMIGYLTLPVLNIKEPIFKGATEQNLINGLATIEATNQLTDQNVSIGGHSVQGVNIRFYNLHKVQKGMEVEIYTKEKARVYEVYDIYQVDPTQVEVLNQKENAPQELTLITCDGYNPADNTWNTRLIVKCKLKSIHEVERTEI